MDVSSVCDPVFGCEQLVTFPGSTEGTSVTIELGNYGSGETGPIPGGLALSSTESDECNSDDSSPIQAGEERTVSGQTPIDLIPAE